MKKYIEVEKLKEDIERQQRKLILLSNTEQVDMRRDCALQNGVYSYILDLIDSLQQEQPEVGDEYFLQVGRYTHILRVGSTSDIDRLLRQDKEQPVEGLEAEIEKVCAEIEERNPQHRGLKPSGVAKIARHFAEWGRKQAFQEIYDGKVKPVDKITDAWLDDEQNT